MGRPRLAMGTRQVVPRFWDNEDLADLAHGKVVGSNYGVLITPDIRLTMIGLWAAADATGRFEWRPRTIAPKIYPHDADDQATVERVMELFVEHGYLHKYEADGKEYGSWPHWGEHNDFRKKNSQYPAPKTQLGGNNPPQSPLEVEVEGRKGKVEEEASASLKVLKTPAAPQPEEDDMEMCKHKDLAKYCRLCKSVQPGAPLQKRKLGWDALEYRESVDVDGVVLTPEEVHTVIHYHWKTNSRPWFRENIHNEEFLLRQFARMLGDFPSGYKIPTRTITTPDSACPLCRGTGIEDFTEEQDGRKYDMCRECSCVTKRMVEL